MRSSLCSSLPQGGESLLVEAEFSAGLAAASTGTSITTSTALATSSSLSTAATSASFTSPSPRLLLAFLSIWSWLPGLPWWAAFTLLTFAALPVGWTSFTITTTAASTSTSLSTATTATSTIASTSSSLVSKGEVDVKFLLASRSLEVDNSFLFLLVILLLVLLLVDRRLFPLGVNIRSLASFPQVKFGTLLLGLLGLPFVQGHLLLLLFPCQLGLQFLSGEFSWCLGLLLGGNFFFALRVDGCVCFLSLLRHIVLKGSPVTLAATSSLVFSLDASSVVPRLPVIVSLAPPAATLSTSTAATTSTTFSSTFAPTVVVTSVLSVALVVPLLPGLSPGAGLARVHHPLALELAVSLVLLVSFVPSVASLLLHDRSFCHRLRRVFDLLGLRDLLLGLTLFEDVQRIRVLVEEESITICHAYTVDVLHLTI